MSLVLPLPRLRKSYKTYNFFPKSYTFDLFRAIPWESMDEDHRARIWDDGIHFTPEGYDLLGSMLADRIVELTTGSQEIGAESAMNSGSDDVRQKPLVLKDDGGKKGKVMIREDEAYAD